MFQKCTVSAVLAAILTITASAALAAPRQRPDETINTVPMSGAERFQNRFCRREAPWRIPGPDVRCGGVSE